jgi:hypothetical protein
VQQDRYLVEVPCELQHQSQPVRDYVLPMVLLREGEDGVSVDSIQGTGFLIERSRGLGVTRKSRDGLEHLVVLT